MSLVIADRFEAGEALTADDRAALEDIILYQDQSDDLVLAINTFFEAFPCEPIALARVRVLLIEHPAPNIAVACLRAIIEHCGEDLAQSLNYTRPYVDFAKFDEWTDEVIYSSNFFGRNMHALSPFDRSRLSTLIERASAEGASELLQLLV